MDHPLSAVMFEDDPRNLKVPFDMGMSTVWIDPAAKHGGHIHAAAADLEEFLEHLVAQHFSLPPSALS